MDEQNQNQQDQQQNQNAGQTPEGSQNSGGGPSFDELLKQHPEYQSEFDRRMTKGVATARSRWEQEQADSQDEAKKVARMTEAQRERYQLDKDKAELARQQAAFRAQQLEVAAGSQLQKMGYDAGYAKFLTGADAETTSANLAAFDSLMQQYRAQAVNGQLRGGDAPREPKEKGEAPDPFLAGFTGKK